MKLKQLHIALLKIIFIMVLLACSDNSNTKSIKYSKKDTTLTSSIDAGWKELSLREKIGQTMIIRAYYNEHIAAFGSIKNMLKKYPVGGIYLPSWRLNEYKPSKDIVKNIKKVVTEYENASKYPLIVTEDFERGVGSVYKGFTPLPVLMSVGATNNKQLAEQFGSVIAKEAKSIGVNWLLHPVADLNMHPLQGLVVERAVSDNANFAYPLLQSVVKGMITNNVIPTIKHFPGDGATMKNQHFVTSENPLSLKEWKKTYGKLYQNFIDKDISCIMVGHISFPAYQKEKIKGVFPPATLSKELMQNLLKKEMHFNGVIMSDALNMGGAAGYYKNELETSIQAFKAGVDLVLWPKLAYLDSIEARIKRGDIPMSRLEDALKRIWYIRQKKELLKKKENLFYPINNQELKNHKKAGLKIAENAITLIEDKNKEIPLNPKKTPKIALVNISYIDRTKEFIPTKKWLQDKGFEVDVLLHNPSFFDWQDKLDYFDQFDKIIVLLENRYFSPLGTPLFKDKESLGLWTISMLPSEKIIAISYSNPYYVNFYFDNAGIKINAYSIDEFSQKAVVEALTGEILFKGKSPVKLSHKIMN